MSKIINFLWIVSKVALISTVLTVLAQPTYSITSIEQLQLKQSTERICNSHNKPCKVQFFQSNRIQGYTARNGTINISSGLSDLLSYNEVEAVIMHELGHHILEHYSKTDYFIDHWDLSQGTLKRFRHKMEIEADLFATSYFILNHKPNYLPSALTKISKDINLTSNTHPSSAKRIKIIQEFTKNERTRISL